MKGLGRVLGDALLVLVVLVLGLVGGFGSPRLSAPGGWSERGGFRWARLVKGLLYMLVTVQNQMALDYLQEKGIMDDYVQKEEFYPNEEKKNAKKTPSKTKGAPIPRGIGNPLPRSQIHQHWDKDPWSRPHVPEHVRRRANRYCQWWVCLRRGSWWERTTTDPWIRWRQRPGASRKFLRDSPNHAPTSRYSWTAGNPLNGSV